MADDQKKESAAKEAQDKVYNSLPEQLAIRLKKNGAIAEIALLGGDEIDASAITDAQYLQIANDLIKDRAAKFKAKSPSGTSFSLELNISELDKRLELLAKDEATRAQYDKAIKALGADSFDKAIPDETRRVKIAKAVGDAVEENTGSLPFLGGASFMNAVIGFFKWLLSGVDGWIDGLKASVTRETANGIAASTEKNLAGADIGLSQDTIKEISTGIRTRVLKEKGVADKDAPEPETLANTKGAEPLKKVAPAITTKPAEEIASPAQQPAPAISPPPPPPTPKADKPLAPAEAAVAAAIASIERTTATAKPDAPPAYDTKDLPVLPKHESLPGKDGGTTQQQPGAPSTPVQPAPKKGDKDPVPGQVEVRNPVAPKIEVKAHDSPKKIKPGQDKTKPGIATAPAPSAPAASPAPVAAAAATPSPAPVQPAPAPAPVQQQQSHLERAIADIANELLADKNIPNRQEVTRDLATFLANNAKDIDLNNPKKGVEKVVDKLFDQSSKDQSAIKTAKAIKEYKSYTPEALVKMGLGNELKRAIRENKDKLEQAIALDNAAIQAGKEMNVAGVTGDGHAPYIPASRQGSQASYR